MNEDIMKILAYIAENMNDKFIFPDPELLIHYENQNDRCIWIEGEIREDLTYYTKLIIKWNAEDKDVPVEERKPIKIFLHTYGGQTDVTSGLCDAILASSTPVWTINAGWSMSSGALILACGHKRFCMKNSAVLIHSGSSGFSGTMQQVKDVAQFLDRLSVNEDKLLLDHTEIPKKTLSAKSKNEWYLFSDDQLKYGLVDKIVESIDEVV